MGTQLISVIIPLYNKENTICRAISSVINQTYPEWEIIIVDDGSNDKSSLALKEYSHIPNITYIYQNNQGVSAARNTGIKNANGDWIIFLDADDYLLNDSLSILHECAIQNKTLVADANYYIESFNNRNTFCIDKYKGKLRNNFRAWYLKQSRPRAGATLIHKSILKHINFNEQLCRNEDIDFFFRIMKRHKVSHTSKCVMIYSMDNLCQSHKSNVYEKDFIFNMNFSSTSFWEKMCLATLINEGYSLYNNHIDILRKRYKFFLLYAKLDVVLHKLLRKLNSK